MTKRKPKEGEYWVVTIRGGLSEDVPVAREVVLVGDRYVFDCGSDEGWLIETSNITFLRKVRL